MKFPGRFILILALLLNYSCSKNSTLFYTDELFEKLYLDDYKSKKSDYKNYEDSDVVLGVYSRIITTGFVYKQSDEIKSYEGEVEVLNYYGKLEKDNHRAINPDYRELFEKINSELAQELKGYKIGVIYDNNYNLSLESYNTIFEIGKYTKKSEVSSFIDNNPDVNFWIVLNKSYINFIYNKILDKKKILMEGDSLFEFDSNLVATVETDFKPYLVESKPISVYIKKR